MHQHGQPAPSSASQDKNGKTSGAFHAPRRPNGLVCCPPPSCHIVAYCTGGLQNLFHEISTKTQPHLHNYGAFTSTKGRFQPQPSMPLLALRYRFVKILAEGQSCIVIKALDTFRNDYIVSIKILHLNYCKLGTQEVDVIRQLNQADPYRFSSVLRIQNTFMFDDHFCLVFDHYNSHTLIEHIKGYTGKDRLEFVRKVAARLVLCLGFLQSQNVIHADLKIENILLADPKDPSTVRVVDFGNAIHCVHNEMSLYYQDFELQTLLYRAPEVMYGLPFGTEVDLWSLGVVLAQLYIGQPFVLGKTKQAITADLVKTLGPLPRKLFQRGKYYRLLEQFTQDSVQAEPVYRLMTKLCCTDYHFCDFISGLLQYDPKRRLNPQQAAKHPFLAPVLGMGHLGGGYSLLALSGNSYKYGPHVQDEISRRHLTSLQLLKEGTSGPKQQEPEEIKSKVEIKHDRLEMLRNRNMRVNDQQNTAEIKPMGGATEKKNCEKDRDVEVNGTASNGLTNDCDTVGNGLESENISIPKFGVLMSPNGAKLCNNDARTSPNNDVAMGVKTSRKNTSSGDVKMSRSESKSSQNMGISHDVRSRDVIESTSYSDVDQSNVSNTSRSSSSNVYISSPESNTPTRQNDDVIRRSPDDVTNRLRDDVTNRSRNDVTNRSRDDVKNRSRNDVTNLSRDDVIRHPSGDVMTHENETYTLSKSERVDQNGNLKCTNSSTNKCYKESQAKKSRISKWKSNLLNGREEDTKQSQKSETPKRKFPSQSDLPKPVSATAKRRISETPKNGSSKTPKMKSRTMNKSAEHKFLVANTRQEVADEGEIEDNYSNLNTRDADEGYRMEGYGTDNRRMQDGDTREDAKIPEETAESDDSDDTNLLSQDSSVSSFKSVDRVMYRSRGLSRDPPRGQSRGQQPELPRGPQQVFQHFQSRDQPRGRPLERNFIEPCDHTRGQSRDQIRSQSRDRAYPTVRSRDQSGGRSRDKSGEGARIMTSSSQSREHASSLSQSREHTSSLSQSRERTTSSSQSRERMTSPTRDHVTEESRDPSRGPSRAPSTVPSSTSVSSGPVPSHSPPPRDYVNQSRDLQSHDRTDQSRDHANQSRDRANRSRDRTDQSRDRDVTTRDQVSPIRGRARQSRDISQSRDLASQSRGSSKSRDRSSQPRDRTPQSRDHTSQPRDYYQSSDEVPVPQEQSCQSRDTIYHSRDHESQSRDLAQPRDLASESHDALPPPPPQSFPRPRDSQPRTTWHQIPAKKRPLPPESLVSGIVRSTPMIKLPDRPKTSAMMDPNMPNFGNLSPIDTTQTIRAPTPTDSRCKKSLPFHEPSNIAQTPQSKTPKSRKPKTPKTDSNKRKRSSGQRSEEPNKRRMGDKTQFISDVFGVDVYEFTGSPGNQ